MLQLQVDDGLIMRSLSVKDTSDVLKVIVDNMDHLHTWIPWINAQQMHMASVQDFIHDQMSKSEHQEGVMLGIFLHQELIGMAGLQHWNHSLGMAELGFWIAKKQSGKGLMSKCLRRLIQFGFSDMSLYRMIANFPITNVGAHKLLERLHFRVEGVLRNHMLHHGLKTNQVIMGFLREEWITQ